MNKKISIITSILMLAGGIVAQDDGPKYRVYGFSDMSFSKAFLGENSFVKSGNMLPENLRLSLDHLNIYTDFNPNNHLRMLVELGYQQKPVNQDLITGQTVTIEGLTGTTVKTVAKPTPSNSATFGTENYEWGSFSVERAVFQLKVNPKVNLSFGKFITPAGIWNVDHGSPAITTIRQPTQFSYVQLIPKSQIGIMEDGTIFLGNSDLSYSLYASTGRNQIVLEEPKDLAVGGQLKLNLPFLNEFRVGVSGYTGINREQLEYMNIIVDSAKVNQIKQQAIGEAISGAISMAAVSARISQLIGIEAAKPDNFSFTTKDNYKYRENVLGGDFKLKYKRLGVQSEIQYQMVNNLLVDSKKTNTLGLYGLISFDAIKRDDFSVTPYFCYEHINLKDGENNPGIPLATMVCGYNVYMYGINMKFFTNFGFKLEYSNVDVVTSGTMKDYQDNGDFGLLSGQFNIAF